MLVYNATHVQYVMVHTDLGFFRVNSLGGISQWNDADVCWGEVDISTEDAAILVNLALAKLSEFKP